MERAILAPLNADVDELNCVIDEAFPLLAVEGQPPERRTYHSTDGIADPDGDGPGGAAALYPVEFLNATNLSGLPLHIIHLQVGAPITLLRNLTAGLANGTRLIVTRLMPRVIEAEVVTGPARGRRMMIPRLRITPSDTQRLPFTIARTQFPERPAFAMTINKAQGQTFSNVGIYLPCPVFSHGQLYVALSRVGNRADVRVLVLPCEGRPPPPVPGAFTRNVIYQELLR